MSDKSQTWHYGLVARYWAEHNTDGPEIPYFQKYIELNGQPALDAGCGTGRLLIPFLQAGLDVDGCDVSDMLPCAGKGPSARTSNRTCTSRRCTSLICRAPIRLLSSAAYLASEALASMIFSP
jgi:SAM-dependent methyltransferase